LFTASALHTAGNIVSSSAVAEQKKVRQETIRIPSKIRIVSLAKDNLLR